MILTFVIVGFVQIAQNKLFQFLNIKQSPGQVVYNTKTHLQDCHGMGCHCMGMVLDILN